MFTCMNASIKAWMLQSWILKKLTWYHVFVINTSSLVWNLWVCYVKRWKSHHKLFNVLYNLWYNILSETHSIRTGWLPISFTIHIHTSSDWIRYYKASDPHNLRKKWILNTTQIDLYWDIIQLLVKIDIHTLAQSQIHSLSFFLSFIEINGAPCILYVNIVEVSTWTDY